MSLKFELIKIKQLRLKEQQRAVYKKIFKILTSKINICIEKEQNYCIFEVPCNLHNEITYPFDECIDYLNNKLTKMVQTNGNHYINEISFFKPNIYYIEWSIE